MAELVRRGRLKIDCRKACGFESRSGYYAARNERTSSSEAVNGTSGRLARSSLP